MIECLPTKYNLEFKTNIHNSKVTKEVDLALLRPIHKIITDKYLPPHAAEMHKEGMDVIICGFSEETKFVLDLDHDIRKILKDQSQIEAFNFFKTYMISPTYKSGIIAHQNLVKFETEKGDVEFQVLHIDNGAHCGMSGGPIISSEGKLIGIITQRNLISTKIGIEDKNFNHNRLIDFEIPSGNTIGLSTHAVSFFRLQRLKCKIG